jgi:uncharacterized protein
MSNSNKMPVTEKNTLISVPDEIVNNESPKALLRKEMPLVETKIWQEPTNDFVCEAPNDMATKESPLSNMKYLLVGVLFGIVFVKGEVVSWFRIQEMFQFTSFHMYGVIGTAVIVGALSVFLIKRLNIKTLSGETVVFHAKKFNKGQVIGGLIFGFGWALTGACPGPLFAQIGTGAAVVVVTLLSAIAGTWTYGLLRDKLPN